jgi:sugar/nucleoside kinase (ribokinase family)
MQPEDVCPEYLDGCKYFHVMGCSVSATESMRETVLKGARAAKAKGAKITFDPNLRPELLENEKVKTVFDEILGMTDILMSGKSELKALLGFADIGETLRALQGKGVSIIVLKDGARGVEVIHKGENIRISAYPVEEVDPTGAGDCFDGAFLACLADGKSVSESAKIATAAGALSVSKKGPMEGAHFREDVLRFASSK